MRMTQEGKGGGEKIKPRRMGTTIHTHCFLESAMPSYSLPGRSVDLLALPQSYQQGEVPGRDCYDDPKWLIADLDVVVGAANVDGGSALPGVQLLRLVSVEIKGGQGVRLCVEATAREGVAKSNSLPLKSNSLPSKQDFGSVADARNPHMLLPNPTLLRQWSFHSQWSRA